MAYHNVRFPISIEYSSKGGPGWSTVVIEGDGGQEVRISRLAQARHQFNAAFMVTKYDDLATLKAFFMARKGATYAFPFKDWADFSSNADGRSTPGYEDQVCSGDVDDSNRDFQLVKVYESDYVTRTRKITKPVSGTVRVAKNGSELLSGWSVDLLTGIVNLTTPPSPGDVITAGFEFDVPVRFGIEADALFQMTMESFSHGSMPSIPLIEVIDEAPLYDEPFQGGAATITIPASTTQTIQPSLGRVLSLIPGNTTCKVKLPDPTDFACGPEYFYLKSTGASGDWDIVVLDHNDFVLGTLDGASEEMRQIVLALIGSTKTWILI